ncbi:hypothetical protein ACFPIJ_47125 [Dactylosporangium cerinum]|uniref:Peptidase S1 domain-containing protein n=1 Tax=Dactylosporangium cerinum TaxID=1434730 RepID=A0ABV9WD04_9ACTN
MCTAAAAILATATVSGTGVAVAPGPHRLPTTTGPPALLQRDTARLPATACGGGFISGDEACYGDGDSGSPVVHTNISTTASRGSRWSQIGIASREISAERPCTEPTIYTDLTSTRVRLWVASTVRTRQVERARARRPS